MHKAEWWDSTRTNGPPIFASRGFWKLQAVSSGEHIQMDGPPPDLDARRVSHFSSVSHTSDRRVAQAAEDCARSHALVRSGLMPLETITHPGATHVI